MQMHKVLNLKKLLQLGGDDVSRYFIPPDEEKRVKDLQNLTRFLVAMGKLKERASYCYAEPIEMNSRQFVAMLLLDSCFIVEVFRKLKLDLWDDDDNVFRTSWVRKKLVRDLLLADNQLPLFVLQEFTTLLRCLRIKKQISTT